MTSALPVPALVLLDTGVRLGELLAIRTDSLDEDRQTITTTDKTGMRNVPAGASCWEAIDRYLSARCAHLHAHLPEPWLGGNGPLTT